MEQTLICTCVVNGRDGNSGWQKINGALQYGNKCPYVVNRIIFLFLIELSFVAFVLMFAKLNINNKFPNGFLSDVTIQQLVIGLL